MKEAINILRKALGENLDPNNPDHWNDESSYKEHQLLSQPEHKSKGWHSNPHSRSTSWGRPEQKLMNGWGDDDPNEGSIGLKSGGANVKSVELRTGDYDHQRHWYPHDEDDLHAHQKFWEDWEPGKYRHTIKRNPNYSSHITPPSRFHPNAHPWMTTHVDTRTGGVVGRSWHRDFSDALSGRFGFDSSKRSFPAATITKIHYRNKPLKPDFNPETAHQFQWHWGPAAAGEYKLLSQPEHKERGWSAEPKWTKWGIGGRSQQAKYRVNKDASDWKSLENSVKALESKGAAAHHVIYRNPEYGPLGAGHKWMRTSIDTRRGVPIIPPTGHPTLQAAVRRGSPITKIHYHDDK